MQVCAVLKRSTQKLHRNVCCAFFGLKFRVSIPSSKHLQLLFRGIVFAFCAFQNWNLIQLRNWNQLKDRLSLKRFLIWIVSAVEWFHNKTQWLHKTISIYVVFVFLLFSAHATILHHLPSHLCQFLFLISSLSSFGAFITCSIYYFLHSLNANWLCFFRGKVLCLSSVSSARLLSTHPVDV